VTTVTYCDICGRQVGAEVITLTIDPGEVSSMHRETLHICKARDGGDIGCAAHFKAGQEHARRLAEAWLAEHRPEYRPSMSRPR
jgi:hypothetical protein